MKPPLRPLSQPPPLKFADALHVVRGHVLACRHRAGPVNAHEKAVLAQIRGSYRDRHSVSVRSTDSSLRILALCR